MSSHRRRCAVVSVGEKLVVAGGLTQGDYSLDTIEMFDLRNRKWFELPNMPCPRFGCAACTIDSKMFLIGGNEKLWMKAYSDRLDSFDVMSQQWEVLPSMAQRRINPAAVSLSLWTCTLCLVQDSGNGALERGNLEKLTRNSIWWCHVLYICFNFIFANMQFMGKEYQRQSSWLDHPCATKFSSFLRVLEFFFIQFVISLQK